MKSKTCPGIDSCQQEFILNRALGVSSTDFVSTSRREEAHMTRVRTWVLATLLLGFVLPVLAQQSPTTTANRAVPTLVNFSGTLTDVNGKPLSGVLGVTFYLYQDQQGGSPLWMETQNVQPYKNGHYSVMLGSTTSQGLPTELFASGEARWLGVQVQGQAEQPRVLLLSVPYALKALDAETIGGKPVSAFQLTAPNSGKGQASAPSLTEQTNEIRCSGSAACKASFVPVFSTNGGSAKVGNSIISQSGTSIAIAGSEGVTSTANGPALVGKSSGTSAGSDGVDGFTRSGTASGVAGINTNGGIGVYGTGGTGVYGRSVSASSTGAGSVEVGLWGDTGQSSGTAVLGTADDGVAGTFANTSTSGFSTLNVLAFTTNTFPFYAYNVANNAHCDISPGGNLSCTGTKNAIVPLDGGKRKVALSAIESPQNWFEDAASAQLVNGRAVVALDADFTQTVNTETEYNVFLTPYGDCKGLYVTNRTATSFEVHELGGGNANISFGYRIMALRRKYETVRFADHTNDPDPKMMLERMRKAKASSSAPAAVKPASQRRGKRAARVTRLPPSRP
jgi:hypothetical protein